MNRTFCLFACSAALALPTQAALIGYWTFDDSGNPNNDSSGAGNHLTSAGADPTYQAAGGFSGGGFLYNGSQRLVAPIDINPGAIPSLTMGAWVRTDSLATGLRKVMGHDNGAWDRTIGLDDRTAAAGGPQPAPALRYSAFTGTNNHGPIQSTPAPASIADWTFLAMVYDQPTNTGTIYIDLDASTSGDALFSASRPTAMGPGQATFSIGSLRPDNLNEGWVGSIDNAFILDHAATAAELTAYRDAGAVPEPATSAYALLIAGTLLLRRKRRA